MKEENESNNQEMATGPIVMEGRVVTNVMMANMKKGGKIKGGIVKRLQFVSKITRGVYSGVYQDDEEYVEFCDNVMGKFIEEQGEEIVQQYGEEAKVIDIKKTIMRNASPVVSNAESVHLRSNPVMDEMIKIDLTEGLEDEQKKDMIEKLIKNNYDDPNDDPISPTCNSSDAGKAIIQVIKNKKAKKKAVKKAKKKAVKKAKKKAVKKDVRKTKKKIDKK